MFPTSRIRVAKLATARPGISPAAAIRFAWRAGLCTLLMSVFLSTLAAGGPASASDESYKVVDGLGVYLGVLPAAILRGPEAALHGGAPSGAHQYHIVVAIFDAATGARIENAKVTATVSGLGHVGSSSLPLGPMTIAGTVTYGEFVTLPGNEIYGIAVDISIPGRSSPVRADFSYQHPR